MKTKAEVWVFSAVGRSLRCGRPAHHQAGAGYNALFVRFDDTPIYTEALAKVVSIDDEESLICHESHSQIVEELCQYSLRPEVFFCDRPSRAAMPLVVGIDGVKSRENIVHGVEGEQAFPRGKYPAEACVLRDHGWACGQVARTALAEPATVEASDLILCDGKFAP